MYEVGGECVSSIVEWGTKRSAKRLATIIEMPSNDSRVGMFVYKNSSNDTVTTHVLYL